MDIELTVKFKLVNFCNESELKGTNITELVHWMVSEEGLPNIILGVPYKITKVTKAND